MKIVLLYRIFFLLCLIPSLSMAKNITSEKWQFTEGTPTIAWGPALTVGQPMLESKDLSTVTPYLRIMDNHTELGFSIKGAGYKHYCNTGFNRGRNSDLYVINNVNVRFTKKCVSDEQLFVYPYSTAGMSYFISTMQLNRDIAVRHYWSDTKWKISSLGFDSILRTMTAWNMMIEESL